MNVQDLQDITMHYEADGIIVCCGEESDDVIIGYGSETDDITTPINGSFSRNLRFTKW